jgi:hypothetical protein
MLNILWIPFKRRFQFVTMTLPRRLQHPLCYNQMSLKVSQSLQSKWHKHSLRAGATLPSIVRTSCLILPGPETDRAVKVRVEMLLSTVFSQAAVMGNMYPGESLPFIYPILKIVK